MARKPRADYPGAWHHVTNHAARRTSVFRHDDHCVLFLDILGEAVLRFGVEIHAYSLIPSQYHLLLRSVHGNVSRAMQYVGGELVQRLNRSSRWEGPVFRGRFRSQLVDGSRHLDALLPYVHLSPVRARLVRRPQEKCWTSHRAYVGLETPPRWLTCGFMIGALGGPGGVRDLVEAYRLGRREWPEWLETTDGWVRDADAQPAPKRPGRRKVPGPSWIATPEATFSRALRISEATRKQVMKVERGPRANPARRFAVWALDRGTTLTHREIGERLGMSTTQVAKVLSRLRSGPVPQPLDQWIEGWHAWEASASSGSE